MCSYRDRVGEQCCLLLLTAFQPYVFQVCFFHVVLQRQRRESQDSVFLQGQGRRTVLPPLADSFPTLRFPGLFFHVVLQRQRTQFAI